MPRAEGKGPEYQPRKYGGKEFIEMHGYDMYDSFARMMDPLTGRTPTPDPHCENYYSISPYAWCGNNFVNRIDGDGRDYWSTNDGDEIIAFLNAWGNKDKQFDFSNSKWSHFANIQSLSKSTPATLTYNDEKNVFHISYAETNDKGSITVTGKSYEADITPVSFDGFGYEGAFVYEPREGFDDHLFYYTLDQGAEYSNEFYTWNVNTQGRITSIKPFGGTPPLPGKIKGGKILQKMEKAKGNMTGNRNVQQKQFDSVVKNLKLTKSQARELHKAIHGQGYGYQEILQEAKELFIK